MVEVICKICGVKFQAKRHTKEYCSNACRQKAYELRKKMEELRSPIEQKRRDGAIEILCDKLGGWDNPATGELLTPEQTIERFGWDYLFAEVEKNGCRWNEQLGIWQYQRHLDVSRYKRLRRIMDGNE